MRFVSSALDYLTATMDDMPLWCIGIGVAITAAVCFSGVLD